MVGTLLFAIISFLLISKLFRSFGYFEQQNGANKNKAKAKKKTITIINNNEKKVSTELSNIQNTFSEYQKINFIEEMENNFDRIFYAFTNARHEELKNYLSKELYESFSEQISKREKANLRQDFSVTHTETIIEEAKNLAGTFKVKMKFKVYQMSATINNDGISYDNPNKLFIDVIHYWIFNRSVFKDKKTNWILTETSVIQ